MINDEKKALRRELKTLRASLPEEYVRGARQSILDLLFSHPAFIKAKTVLTYYPVGSELDVLEIARYSLSLGKQVAFPLCHPEGPYMTFHLIDSFRELSATVGSYGIPEPREDSPVISDLSDSICIVPALAFSRDGFRIGYGKGYYDRFLDGFDGISVGLVYHRLLLDSLPTDKYDKKVQLIITEKEVLPTDEALE